MCGIAGLYAVHPDEPNLVYEMTQTIRHRGPDDEGFLAVDTATGTCLHLISEDSRVVGERIDGFTGTANLFLGHRRLSIVDPSPAGHQPMCSPDRRFWIVYNGEVYNHIELRSELETHGHVFRSHSDTEVILAAYREWGTDCLSHFNGMFAFLLYDSLENKLFVARDRFGVKPLYYWVSPCGTIAFASEIKAFTVLPGWNARMNGQRIYDFLVWSVQDHTDETMFADVYQIPPGHCVMLKLNPDVPVDTMSSGGRLPCVPWWQLKPDSRAGSMAEAVKGFATILTDSVRLRLRADVPIGSCLSGGLDSSSIVCVTNQLLRDQGAYDLQKTFSSCSEVKRFDERTFMDEVIRHTEVDPQYVYPALDGLFAENESVAWHQDEPFGSASIYAQWKVFDLAANNNVKVMLDGQGADEHLAGYHVFFEPYLTGLFRRRELRRLAGEMGHLKRIHGYSFWSVVKMIMGVLLPQATRNTLKRWGGKSHTAPEWLDLKLLGAMPLNPFDELGYRTDSVQALSRAQLAGGTLPMLLHWEDRNSMAHSIETRLPFLDYRMVEFVMSLPDNYKISDGTTKKILREAMKGVLPEKVRQRQDKIGFVTPEEVWVKNENPELFRRNVADAVAASRGVLKGTLNDVADKIISGEKQFNHLIWRIISFANWVKVFNVGSA